MFNDSKVLRTCAGVIWITTREEKRRQQALSRVMRSYDVDHQGKASLTSVYSRVVRSYDIDHQGKGKSLTSVCPRDGRSGSRARTFVCSCSEIMLRNEQPTSTRKWRPTGGVLSTIYVGRTFAPFVSPAPGTVKKTRRKCIRVKQVCM